MKKARYEEGHNVKRVLQKKMDKGGWKQADMAEATNVSRKTISDWMKGTLINSLKYKYVVALSTLFQLKGEEKKDFFTDLGYPDTQKKELPKETVKQYHKHIVILYDGMVPIDKQQANLLASILKAEHYRVEFGNNEALLETTLENADWVITIVSSYSAYSESLLEKVSFAYEITQKNYSHLTGLFYKEINDIPQNLANLLTTLHTFESLTSKDNAIIVKQLLHKIIEKPNRPYELEMISGAIPLNSNFYIKRQADEQFNLAFQRNDSSILIKGARQVGKTSLLARGIQTARQAGYLVLLTDFQRLVKSDLESLESFFIAIGCLMADQLRLDIYPQDMWSQRRRTPNGNFDMYIRDEILRKTDKKVLWAIDEADKVLSCPFSDDIFSLFRSWHNDRALSPDEPCNRLSIALSYSTEPYLFIKDINQSPFNVGTKVILEDFTLEQIKDLNYRYGSPLLQSELNDFHEFTGGQPYLVRCILNELITRNLAFEDLPSYIEKNETVLTDHLKRIFLMLSRDESIVKTIKKFLQHQEIESYNHFLRLRSGGVLIGSQERPRFRCQLYENYLSSSFSK